MVTESVSSGEQTCQAAMGVGEPEPTGNQPPRSRCNGHTFWQALCAAGAWLDANVEAVNALNVFPVPDGDTGTNMSLTMRAALQEASGPDQTVSRVMRVVSDGALMGARGNSGVILSQILRGLARALDGKEEVDALDLALALQEGAATAYKGVMKPVEGTMLTVARELAAAALRAAEAGAGLADTLEVALLEARASLERTPLLLPVLAEAGVVDSGGKGLVVMLEGALRYVRGEPVLQTAAPEWRTEAEIVHVPDGQYNYDTQFIIKGHDLDVAAIREEIAALGDSVLVVGDGETVKVHVHCDFPGQALDVGVRLGQVTAVIIDNMQLQYEEYVASQQRAAPHPAAPARAAHAIGVIAVASGEGLQNVLKSLGVDAIVSGGQTMNPSTQDLLQAIAEAPSERVIVLPNNSNIILTARQAAQLSPKEIAVIPTHTVPEGIAALLALNYQADLDTNRALMEEAAEQVRTVEVTVAVRSAQVNGLAIREGQVIGLLDGGLKTAGDTVSDVVGELLETIGADDCEILTIYYGQDVTEDAAEALGEEVRAQYPHLEVEVLSGGQAHYYYVMSVE